MPLYEYQCEVCGRRFEVIQKFSDAPVETCTACGKGPVRQLLSSPAIQFKGSGWYITDYSKKGQAPESSAAAQEGAKSDTKQSETKSADASGKGDAAPASAPASAPAAPAKD